jgi:hypothetical protein
MRTFAVGYEEPPDDDWRPEPSQLHFNPLTYQKTSGQAFDVFKP